MPLLQVTVGPLVAQGASFVQEAFVDKINGDDANDGLTALTALQTFGGLYAKFPLWVFGNGAKLIVNVAGVGGFGGNATAQLLYDDDSALLVPSGEGASSSYVYRGPQMVPFTPTTGPATAALDVVPAVTVGLRTRFDFTTAAPGWTVNDLAGAFLRLTRGADLVLWELPIAANTADTLFVDTISVVGAVLATDVAEIVIPGARIEGNFAVNFGVLGLVSPAAGQLTTFSFNPGLTFERLEFGFVWARGVSAGFDRCTFTLNATLALSTIEMVNCAAKSPSANQAVSIGGTFAASVSGRPDSGTSPIDPTPSVCFTGAENIILAFGVLSFAVGTCEAQVDQPISVYRASFPSVIGAVHVSGGSTLYMFGATGTVQGDGNSGVGLHADTGGRARIVAAQTTITGVAGDLKVGTGAAVPYGAGVGGFSEALGFNGNLHRLGGSTPTVPLGDMSQITTFV